MTAPALRWHLFQTAAEAAAAVAAAIGMRAAAALARGGRFSIVLAGGTTPAAAYRAAAQLETDWQRWHVYFGDERCVPLGHENRNDRLCRETWLDHVAIPPSQVHSIPAELGPEGGARRYRATLAGIGPFDVVLLGCGSDGHTASLFPGHALGAEPNAPDVLPVRDAPKPPPERVTLSAARLSRADSMLLLANGADKRAALQALRDGAAVPLAAVAPPHGLDVFADRAAAG